SPEAIRARPETYSTNRLSPMFVMMAAGLLLLQALRARFALRHRGGGARVDDVSLEKTAPRSQKDEGEDQCAQDIVRKRTAVVGPDDDPVESSRRTIRHQKRPSNSGS